MSRPKCNSFWGHTSVEFEYSNMGFNNEMKVCLRCGLVETRPAGGRGAYDWVVSGYIDNVDLFRIAVLNKQLSEKRSAEINRLKAENEIIPVQEIIKIYQTGWEELGLNE